MLSRRAFILAAVPAVARTSTDSMGAEDDTALRLVAAEFRRARRRCRRLFYRYLRLDADGCPQAEVAWLDWSGATDEGFLLARSIERIEPLTLERVALRLDAMIFELCEGDGYWDRDDPFRRGLTSLQREIRRALPPAM